jgi:iron complex outermembrane receptor protein
MTRIDTRVLLYASTAIAGIAATMPAAAQTSPTDAAQQTMPGQPSGQSAATIAPVSADDAGQADGAIQTGIQDIVVTARRREESLQNAPVTITAFSGSELVERGINDFSRLAQATPGINFDAFPKAAPRPFFRGVGSSNQGAGGDPSSVAFLDGVYLARAAMLGIDFYDMERIEVLKGPQGTLWGKNVVAGSVNFVTAKPSNTAEATGQLTFGEFGQKNGNLMLNVPVGDAVAARLVLGAVTNDGFRRTLDGRALDDENKLSARLQVRADLAPGTRLLLSADVADQDLSDSSRYNVIRNPFTPGRGYADFDDPRRSNPDRLGFTRSTTGGARAELTTDVLGFADWTTVAAWRTLKFDFSNDLDGTNPAGNAATGLPVSGLQVLANEHANSYSVESRLSSRGMAPFSWVAGLYYNRDNIFRERETQQSATPSTINRFFGHSENDSYAVFGEAQYKFDFGLRFFAGGRFTQEKKVYRARRLTGSLLAPTTNYDTETTPGVFEKGIFTYRGGVDFRLNDNIFAFATISTGFKSGAFQEQPGSAVLARAATAPEKVTNYEIGVKTDWFDRMFRANISAFRMDYRDFQTIKVVSDATQGPVGTRVVLDSGDARIEGVESEFVVAPAAWFDATVRYTYLHPYFTKFIQTTAILANGSPVFTDGAGNRLSRTPKHAVTADVGIQSSKEADWGWLRANVIMDYQSDAFENNINDFNEYRRPRTLWDASLTYHLNPHYSVQVWGHNITNETYRIWQTNGGFYQYVQYGAPRQFGVTLSAALR